MATEQEVIDRFTELKIAVGEWSDKTITRVNDEIAFLKSIKGSTKKLTDETSSKEAELAFRDVTDFLQGSS